MSKTLLTDELKKRVLERIKECYSKAEAHYQISMTLPEIRYDIKSWVGGLAYRDKNLIRLNLIFLLENLDHFIQQTVAHEAAHMIVNALIANGKIKLAPGKKKHMPHGKEWREVMTLLGVPANVTHSYDVSSIQKVPRKPSAGIRPSRVLRILKTVSNFSREEQNDLIFGIKNNLTQGLS